MSTIGCIFFQSGMIPLKVKMLEKALSRLLLPHTNSHAILQTVWTGSLVCHPELGDREFLRFI